jgi:hypothetical protein
MAFTPRNWSFPETFSVKGMTSLMKARRARRTGRAELTSRLAFGSVHPDCRSPKVAAGLRAGKLAPRYSHINAADALPLEAS